MLKNGEKKYLNANLLRQMLEKQKTRKNEFRLTIRERKKNCKALNIKVKF